ncbi:MAG TPA: peptide-methionine (S)-S-oxide reductase MsrA [Bacteroidota bacterium]|nr:peptide-methionine (S)-S-oxide reductase MsrA [Bacteroidota bacterium]
MKTIFTWIVPLLVMIVVSCAQQEKQSLPQQPEQQTMSSTSLDTATLAMGCFWCTEAIFQNLKGVQSVVSGYAGGTIKNPSYEDVCTGTTGHAEASQITYDPKQVSFDDLLKVFWRMHDPTTLNQQGDDVGTQYRSAIFYHNEEQKKIAEQYKKELDSAGIYSSPIVTEITPFTTFYKAEDYHQNYYNQHGNQPYCRLVIQPKVEKFEKIFKDKLKQ